MKKTLNDYLKLPYRMEFVRDETEGGYAVSFPDLPGCITCSESLTAAATNAEDAKKAWLEAALAEGLSIPEPRSEERRVGKECRSRWSPYH